MWGRLTGEKTGTPGMPQSMRSQRVGHDWMTELNWISCIWSEVKWSCSDVSDCLRSHGLEPTRLLHPWDFPGKSTGVGCHFLLQRIFPTWVSNPGLRRCRQTLYCLSYQGSPHIYGDPTCMRGLEIWYTWDGQRQKGKIRSVCHPEPRNGIGT